MQKSEQSIPDDLQYYFVVAQSLPDGTIEAALSSYAPFRADRTTQPFDSEEDAALYLLEEMRKGIVVPSNDAEIARSIIRGDRPLFLFEEKQPDGRLLLSLHDHLPPVESVAVAFGSRAPRLVARLLLRRLAESQRVWATEETIAQAQALGG